MRKFLTALTLLMFSLGTAADNLTIKDDVPDRYVVKTGDTLWDIASMFLNDPWAWESVWYLNPEVENPHLIFPGDMLALVQIDGEVRLTTVERSIEANTVDYTPENSEVMADGTIRLKPGVRFEALERAISAIPREQVASFLVGNQVVSSQQIQDAAYIIAGDEGRLILGAGDRIYARGNWIEGIDTYEIFRPGNIYIDPVTDKFLGYEAVRIGRSQIIETTADVAEMRIVESDQNARIGDRVMVMPSTEVISNFYPNAPEVAIDGQILSVSRGVNAIGQWDVVILNRGTREGVELGTVFNVMRAGDVVKDPIREEFVRLPSSQAGRLMVFRTFERLSYALVMEAQNTMAVGDKVVTPDLL